MDRRIYFGSGLLLLALALVISVVAYGPAGAPVKLLTGDGEPGCFAANTTGLLIVDPRAGTAIVEEDMDKGLTDPVSWPTGFTGRTSGDQVEVLDTAGHVVARTGQRYELLGGYNVDGTWDACVNGVYPPLWPSPR
jgi:hypothetical protein